MKHVKEIAIFVAAYLCLLFLIGYGVYLCCEADNERYQLEKKGGRGNG